MYGAFKPGFLYIQVGRTAGMAGPANGRHGLKYRQQGNCSMDEGLRGSPEADQQQLKNLLAEWLDGFPGSCIRHMNKCLNSIRRIITGTYSSRVGHRCVFGNADFLSRLMPRWSGTAREFPQRRR